MSEEKKSMAAIALLVAVLAGGLYLLYTQDLEHNAERAAWLPLAEHSCVLGSPFGCAAVNRLTSFERLSGGQKDRLCQEMAGTGATLLRANLCGY